MAELLKGWFTNPMFVLALAGLIVSAIVWVVNVNRDRKDFRELATEIKRALDELLTRIPRVLAEGRSPAQLTDYGHQIAKESGVDVLARELAPRLRGNVKDREEFEIHDFCTEYVSGRLSAEESRIVSKGAFETGRTRQDIEMILAILLRNELVRLAGR